MKRKYLAVTILMLFIGIIEVKALTIGDCKVLASFKQNSSLDEEKYICKDMDYGNPSDPIYYSSKNNTIYLKNYDAYYFTNWENFNTTIDISGQNNIAFLQLENANLIITGNGTLKFKQNSFVKKVINGNQIFRFVYNNQIILNEDKKIYEGTTLDFAENYEVLKELNKLPIEYNSEEYELISVIDYSKMTSVIVTDNWLSKHIETSLNTRVADGYGIVEYVATVTEPSEEKNKTITKLETDNVILISEDNLQSKYELKETNIKNEEISTKISEETNQNLLSLYDVTIYNGTNEVSMKNGKYTIKIKLDEGFEEYENYQIIYLNDNNEVEEYLNGTIEDDYIVFETTHLSQYGIIASPKSEKIFISLNGNKGNNQEKLNHMLKLSILLSIIVGAITLINFIKNKSNLHSKKKHKN